jgi:UDP-galactopyranose mutase
MKDMENKYDYLLVGAGLYNAVFAHQLFKAGKQCLVVEKRKHIGGNVYCENCEGINIHKYGAHIFHTNNEFVWRFINRFVEFNRYTNSPIANFKGKLFNLPFNMNTFYQMWGVTTPSEAARKIDSQRAEATQLMRQLGISEPQNLEQQAITLVGKDIYKTLIKGYTEKQWGRKCSELPAFIIKRIPVRFTFDNNYFDALYQGIPIGGYNKLIDSLFNGIDYMVNTDYLADRARFNDLAERIVFSGPIDAFYDFRYGKLSYRTVRFENELLDMENYQGNAVVNYTDAETPYTRIIEHKHFEFGHQLVTVVSKEYPVEWKEGMEPYYPINDYVNTTLYRKYEELSKVEKKVLFGGRLAEYKYYDMDKVIEKALSDADKELNSVK